MWRQENHADKLRKGYDEVHEDESEQSPEAIPDGKVDRLERHRHCGNGCYPVEDELVDQRDISD
jgi:hypothetical protein